MSWGEETGAGAGLYGPNPAYCREECYLMVRLLGGLAER